MENLDPKDHQEKMVGQVPQDLLDKLGRKVRLGIQDLKDLPVQTEWLDFQVLQVIKGNEETLDCRVQ